MLQDGLILADSSVATNFQIQNGTTLPSSGLNIGELFFLTSGAVGLYVYNGAAWLAAGSSSSLTFSGDATGSGLASSNITFTLANVNSNIGSFGSGTQIPVFTVNSKGLITSASTTVISVSQTDVTQHQAALTILESQITDGSILARVAGNEMISGSWTFTSTVTGVDPTISTHLATKQYVDNVAAGLDPKSSVRVATTGNITLSGTQTIDGIAVIAGDRVLVKNQTTGSENGIYVAAAGAWARSADFDGTPASEVTSGAYTFVTEGTANGAKGFVLITNGMITVGTTAQAWTEISAAPTTASAGSLTGTTLASNVVSSSLTSVGTLGSLTVTGATTSGSFVGPLTGNASTATVLQTARTINGIPFNGSANISIDAPAGTLSGSALSPNVLSSGLTTVGTLISLNVSGTTTSSSFSGPLSGNATTATSLQTARTINGVSFDGSSNITVVADAGTLSGTTLNSTVVSSSLTSVGTITSGTWSGSFGAVSGANLTSLNASNLGSGTVPTARLGTGTASATTILYGNNTWGLSSFTLGNVSIALGSTITALTGMTSITSTAFTGALTGNASTATTLQTTRTINGVSFNGSTDITVSAAAGTLTGTTLPATITGSSLTSVGTLGSLAVTGNVTAAEPTTSTHLTTKNYVDNLVTGLTWKSAARVGTTANITLSGTQTIDGVAVIAGDRVLVKNQTTTSQNGIYVVAAGAWARAVDFDASPTVGEVNGSAVFVREGTANAESAWTQTAEVTTIGTDPITFVIFSSTGGAVARSGDTMTGVLTNASGFVGPLTGNVTGSVTGASSLNVLKAGDTMTGALTVAPASGTSTVLVRSTSALAQLVLDQTTSGFGAQVYTKTGGLPRWGFGGNSTVESGSNTGSSFTIDRYNDAGSYVDTPFSISRASGTVTIPNNLTVTGTLLNGQAATSTTTTSVSTTSITTIDTFATASFRTAKYIVQVFDSTNSQFHAVEILIIHDGTTVYKTEYAEVTSVASLGTFDASITTGSMNLTFQATAATTKTVKVHRTAIGV